MYYYLACTKHQHLIFPSNFKYAWNMLKKCLSISLNLKGFRRYFNIVILHCTTISNTDKKDWASNYLG